jgi:HNH endonuclease/AP2 domain
MRRSQVAVKRELTAAYLREILHYNPDTEIWTWRVLKGTAQAGDVAGSINKRGYTNIQIVGRLYQAHRLAFLYMTGKWPSDQIDHVNIKPSDNRWSNLREATNSQNQANKHAPSTNTSGYKGVSWHRGDKKWQARIGRNRCHLGYFNTAEVAAAAYEQAAKVLHGEFARVTTMKNEPAINLKPVSTSSILIPVEQSPPMKHHFEFTLEGKRAERAVSIAVGVIAAFISCAKVTNITIEK